MRVKKTKFLTTNRALRHFGFRQTLRGMLVIGLLAGIMMGAQGAGYAFAYPDEQSRQLFVSSLKSAPAIGFLAGEADNALTPASYSIYKSIAIMTLLTSIWGLLVTTRLLRGQEEDGRLEQIIAGQTSKANATWQMLIGYSYSTALAFLIAWGIISAFGANHAVNLSVGAGGLLTAGVFLPGVFFASLGVLTSQLAFTRGRALAYGLVPLVILYVLRGSANSVPDWNWLKHISPFGWTDLMNPVLDAHVIWIFPTFVFTAIALTIGLYLARIRDLGNGIIPQSDIVKSRFYLLGSPTQLAIRQNIGTFLWWCIGTVAYAGLLASIAKIGADALSSSPAFTHVATNLGGIYDSLIIAFIGLGGLFTAMILLVMSAVCVGNIRREEAKGFFDNLLIQPVGRVGLLAKRLLLIVVMVTAISLISGYTVWQITANIGVSINLGTMLQNSLALTGPIILLLGIGTAFYGLMPRIAVFAMFAVIIWAFLVDILKALFSLNGFIDKTSILHYISFVPTKTPDWSTFAWLVAIGFVLAVAGIIAFTRRDIVAE